MSGILLDWIHSYLLVVFSIHELRLTLFWPLDNTFCRDVLLTILKSSVITWPANCHGWHIRTVKVSLILKWQGIDYRKKQHLKPYSLNRIIAETKCNEWDRGHIRRYKTEFKTCPTELVDHFINHLIGVSYTCYRQSLPLIVTHPLMENQTCSVYHIKHDVINITFELKTIFRQCIDECNFCLHIFSSRITYVDIWEFNLVSRCKKSVSL